MVHPRETTPFVDYLVFLVLVDMQSLGCFYTWSKGVLKLPGYRVKLIEVL